MMGMLAFISINAETTYPVNLNVGSNGSASVDKSEAAVGETVTITASPYQWYEVDEVTVVVKYEPEGGGGGALAPRRVKIAQGSFPATKVDDTTYTFDLPEQLDGVFNLYTTTTEFEVKVTFKEKPTYTVRLVQPTSGGSLSFYTPYTTEDEIQAHVGEEIVFSADNFRGYVFESAKVVVGGTENELTLTHVENPYFNRYSFVLPETLPGTSSEYQDDTYFEISAVFPQRQFGITIIQAEHGTVEAEPDYASAGMTTYFNVTPEGGYKIDNLLIKYVDDEGHKTNVVNDSWGYTQSKVNNFQYSLKLNGEPVYYYSANFHLDHFEVIPTYSLINYHVNIESTEHGSVSADKVTDVNLGDVVTLTIGDIDEGYVLESLVVKVGDSENELPLTKIDDTHYTFTLTSEPLKGVDTDQLNVVAVFSAKKYNIIVDEPENGTITLDKTSAAIGETVQFTIKANPGYKLKTENQVSPYVTATYEAQGGGDRPRAPRRIPVSHGNVQYYVTGIDGSEYTFAFELPESFDGITPDYKETTEFHVGAEFEQLSYQVIVNYGDEVEHGTVTTSASTVTYGETVTISYQPDEGYEANTKDMYKQVIPKKNEVDSYNTIYPEMVGQDRNTYSFVVEGEEYEEGTIFYIIAAFQTKPVRYDIVIEPTENGTVTTDVADLAIGETATITLEPAAGYQVGEVSVMAGYEVAGDDAGGAHAPRRAQGDRWYKQGDVTVTQIDDTHYTFTAPESFDNILTPNYTADTQFKVVVTFEEQPCIDLENRADNTDVIEENMYATVNVRLKDRTLSGNGIWNTLCLPFDLTIAGSVLDGAVVKELTSSSYDQATTTLTLEFTEVSEMVAGKPYIVRWTTGEGLTEPEFIGVTISAEAPADQEVGVVTLKGTYAPVVIEDEDHTKLFFGSNNKLYYPNGAAPTNINSQRFYFQLADGLHAEEASTTGEETSDGTKFRLVVVDGEATGIDLIRTEELEISNDDAWYDLSGRKLTGRPETPGIYINNGRKYVIK